MARGQLDALLPGPVLRLALLPTERRHMSSQRRRPTHHLLKGIPRQGQHRRRRHRLGREVPQHLRAGHRRIGEVIPVSEHPQHRLVAVLARADLVHLPMGDQTDQIRRLTPLDDHLPRTQLPLGEPTRQRPQHTLVLELAQQSQLPQLLGDDLHLRPGRDERHLPVTQRVRQTAVHPVTATRDLHPRQHPQQPPRGDLLHLRHGLRRRRQLPRRRRAQAQLRMTVPHMPVHHPSTRHHNITHRVATPVPPIRDKSNHFGRYSPTPLLSRGPTGQSWPRENDSSGRSGPSCRS